jgi:hypothetical protein
VKLSLFLREENGLKAFKNRVGTAMKSPRAIRVIRVDDVGRDSLQTVGLQRHSHTADSPRIFRCMQSP